MGKSDPQLRLKDLDGAHRASFPLHKKTVALQKPKTDPLGSLHQCETPCVSEAPPPPCGGPFSKALGSCPSPTSPGSLSFSCCQGTGPTPLQSPGGVWSLTLSLGSCPPGLGRSRHHDPVGLKPGHACPECHCILSFPIARLDVVPSRLAMDQGKMIFHVPSLSSAEDMFVVCPKEQLRSGVGRATREVPCPIRAPCHPRGHVLGLYSHPAFPAVSADSSPSTSTQA